MDRLKNSNDRLVASERVVSPGEKCSNERLVTNDQLVIRNDKSVGNEKLSYKEITSPEFTSFKPILEAKSPDSGSLEETGIGKRPDLLSRVCKCWIFNRNSRNGLNTPRGLSLMKSGVHLINNFFFK